MLAELSIRHFAIIDDLTISFDEGLTVLSGETGAGKSIIINAVNLLLGARASAAMIRTGAEQAELEALFHIPPQGPAAEAMRHQELDAADGLVVRRIIARNNRHKVYINGRLSTMTLLARLTASLASISGQHANQLLFREEEHLRLLDRFGGLMPLRQDVYDRYHSLLPLLGELASLKAAGSRRDEQRDLYRFQREEILQADLQPEEENQLQQELERLKNADLLHATASRAIDRLYGASGAVVEQIVEVRKQIEKAAAIDPALAEESNRLDDTVYRIEDTVEHLRGYRDTIDMDPHRLETVEERLLLVRQLIRKYGGTEEALREHLTTIKEKLDTIDNIDETIAAHEERIGAEANTLAEKALLLSRKRKKSAIALAQQVETELAELKMAGTRFDLDFTSREPEGDTPPPLVTAGRVIDETGCDRVTFMISPNVGEALKPLAAIASGGELSRVVLALKAILASNEALETVVFDEVDAGIGGGVAERVGRKLATLARHHQIICITHLPQIARYARHHFSISKSVTDGRTRTTITPLDEDSRVREIARMLGGEKVTPTTIDHAREMLATGRKTE
jgi:DNA repair protein RecN (Recombination protein N)